MAHLPSLFLLYSANTLVPLGQGLFAVLISYVILTAVLLSGGKSSWRMLFYTLSVCRLKDVLKMLFILSLIIMEKIDFYSTFPVHWWLKLLYNACLIHPLMTESAMQGADRSSGAIWGFSVLLKDTSTRSRGSLGFEPATIPSTGWLALPELQPPNNNHNH